MRPLSDHEVPTMADLLKQGPGWVRVYCERIGCGHHTALWLAPLVEKLGPDTSSNVLRRSLRCAKCGAKGATIQHPSWLDTKVGWEPFPGDP